MRLLNLGLNKLDHLLFWIALHQFDPVDTLMDIGCGNHPQNFIEVKERFYTVDPSVDHMGSGYFHVKGTWENPAMNILRNNNIDTVVLMDVMEHIEKKEALRLLKETQKYVNQIIVFIMIMVLLKVPFLKKKKLIKITFLKKKLNQKKFRFNLCLS